MRDLGLPSFDDPVGSVGLGEEVGGGRSQGPGGAAVCQKFQLGETLPVVPARIVRRVLRGDFVDMAELTEDNLELELRRGSEADEGKPVPLHKLNRCRTSWHGPVRSACTPVLWSAHTPPRPRICGPTWPRCWQVQRGVTGGGPMTAALGSNFRPLSGLTSGSWTRPCSQGP